MKILFIGGTGNISSASVRLAVAQGHDVYLFNRGRRTPADFGITGAKALVGDIHDESSARDALGGHTFDVVTNFIAFKPSDIERDVRLFTGRCAQYIFISSASVYQKPPAQPFVTESTPLKNPHWAYARDKIACENACLAAYRENNFPLTIVRPSLTYQTVIPVAMGSWTDFTIVDRMRRRQPVVVHGDGASLWTITHAEDFALGFNGLFGSQQALGEAFHITSDEVLTWNQIYDAVGIAAGAGAPEKIHVPSAFIAKLVPGLEGALLGDKAVSAIMDNTKIKRVVPQFRPAISFQAGIARTIRWFEAKPGRMVINAAANAMLDGIIAAYKPVFDALKPL
ncbi:MAG: NAD-dependent epimerase/dehydratase family protein [Opitutaceae bacterium]|jgi:nucleoside-diphosphate-sugar epimerase|nr:NAD-dependent epimerase/dehydratase family protein [Opitutaceae bacterium]